MEWSIVKENLKYGADSWDVVTFDKEGLIVNRENIIAKSIEDMTDCIKIKIVTDEPNAKISALAKAIDNKGEVEELRYLICNDKEESYMIIAFKNLSKPGIKSEDLSVWELTIKDSNVYPLNFIRITLDKTQDIIKHINQLVIDLYDECEIKYIDKDVELDNGDTAIILNIAYSGTEDIVYIVEAVEIK